MKKAACYIFMILFIGLFLSCGKKNMPVGDYQNYINNPANGLRIEVQKKDIGTDFSMETMDWQAFKASYSNKQVDKQKFKEFKEKNKGLLQFSFKVFLPQKDDLYTHFSKYYENPEEAMLYSEYELKDDFKLFTGNDSISALATHHQPSFGLKAYEEFLILFDTKDEKIETKPLEIIYRDHLFKIGDITYSFSQETMNNIPSLSI